MTNHGHLNSFKTTNDARLLVMKSLSPTGHSLYLHSEADDDSDELAKPYSLFLFSLQIALLAVLNDLVFP